MLHIGFTGTRNGMTQRQKDEVEAILSDEVETKVHHGDCVGADAEVDELAEMIGVGPCIIHPPTDSKARAWCHSDTILQPRPYLQRNRSIVDQTIFLIAAPSGPEKVRSGTWSTIRYAKSKGRL